jgi:hypothetical protein
MVSSHFGGGIVHMLITVLLLLVVVALPLVIWFSVMRFLHRHNLPDHFEPPDTIDYNKW